MKKFPGIKSTCELTFKLPSGRQLLLEGYSARDALEGVLEGNPNYILYLTLKEAAESLGHYGFLIIPEGCEKFKDDRGRTGRGVPNSSEKASQLLSKFPRFLVSATLSSGRTEKSEEDTDTTRIKLGFFCERLPPDVRSVLPSILQTLDWEQHARDYGF